MTRWLSTASIPVVSLALALASACNPVAPVRREVMVTGTVYFDQVPDSGWSVLLNMPAASSGTGGFCLGLCGGGYASVGRAVTGPDGSFTITGEVGEDTCGQMWLQLGARDDKAHRLTPEGSPGRQIPCGSAPGYDFFVDSGWP